MNINELTHGQHPKASLLHTDSSRLAGTSASSDTATGSKPTSVDSKLIDRLTKTQVETRSELISDIKSRIQNGAFLTREAAESVADSILGK